MIEQEGSEKKVSRRRYKVSAGEVIIINCPCIFLVLVIFGRSSDLATVVTLEQHNDANISFVAQ